MWSPETEAVTSASAVIVDGIEHVVDRSCAGKIDYGRSAAAVGDLDFSRGESRPAVYIAKAHRCIDTVLPKRKLSAPWPTVAAGGFITGTDILLSLGFA